MDICGSSLSEKWIQTIKLLLQSTYLCLHQAHSEFEWRPRSARSSRPPGLPIPAPQQILSLLARYHLLGPFNCEKYQDTSCNCSYYNIWPSIGTFILVLSEIRSGITICNLNQSPLLAAPWECEKEHHIDHTNEGLKPTSGFICSQSMLSIHP